MLNTLILSSILELSLYARLSEIKNGFAEMKSLFAMLSYSSNVKISQKFARLNIILPDMSFGPAYFRKFAILWVYVAFCFGIYYVTQCVQDIDEV